MLTGTEDNIVDAFIYEYSLIEFRSVTMSWMRRKSILLASLSLVPMILLGTPEHAAADTWRGTGPFCKGQCLKGEVQVGTSKKGNGAYCVTGHKALCRNNQAMCPATQTKTSCVALVMICDNGYYDPLKGNAWHSCNKYGCGACVGFSN